MRFELGKRSFKTRTQANVVDRLNSHNERYGMDVCLRHEAKCTVAVSIDVKMDLAESWQTICAAAAEMTYLICSACELMLEAVIHTV
jgi:hypothetical protein